jgi:hypothetical protein
MGLDLKPGARNNICHDAESGQAHRTREPIRDGGEMRHKQETRIDLL